MILMKIQGGLGNQMFQWACGRSLSIERHCSLIIDTSSFIADRKRSFRLPLFNKINQAIFTSEVFVLNTSISGFTQITDDFKTFDFSRGEIHMNGYWQSELFFKNIKKVIEEDFNLINYEYILRKYPIIDRTISLHIRRGDYVTSNGYHPVQPLSYYEKALDIIGDWNKLLVFSDDIEWCKNNLNFDKVQFVEEANEFETLYLMSHVQDNIIANSSFSWWGAWLNKNPQKRVIAPNLWFGEISGICTDYIVPNTWIKI